MLNLGSKNKTNIEIDNKVKAGSTNKKRQRKAKITERKREAQIAAVVFPLFPRQRHKKGDKISRQVSSGKFKGSLLFFPREQKRKRS